MRKSLILASMFAMAVTAGAQPAASIETAKRTADKVSARYDSTGRQIDAAPAAAMQSVEAQQGTATPPATADTSKPAAPAIARQMPTLTREVYAYDGGGRRDPFLSLVKSGALRPNITELTLMTTLVGPGGNPNATLLDETTKERYLVKVGDTIGRYRVMRIENRSVTFSIEEFGVSRQERLVMSDSTQVRNR